MGRRTTNPIEIIEQTSLPRILLFLANERQANISTLKAEIKASQHAIYNALDKLGETKLITDKKNGTPPFERVIKITETGKAVARKLACVFDDGIEVVAIPKRQYNLLNTVLEKHGESGVENFVLNSIVAKIKQHKALKSSK